MMTALMNDDAMTEPQLIMLDVDACEPSDWNPNVEDLATFNELVENIRQVGMVDPIQVMPLRRQVSHRWRRAPLEGVAAGRARGAVSPAARRAGGEGIDARDAHVLPGDDLRVAGLRGASCWFRSCVRGHRAPEHVHYACDA